METTEIRNERRGRCGSMKHKAGWIVLGVIGGIAFAFLFGAVVMWLWNWLMPVIFHLGVISYWQAVGLAILGRLLFGSFHHGSHHRGNHKMGPWKHWHHGNSGATCRDYSHGSKWSHYDQYWNEEGEKSFNDYLKRKEESPQ
ncbi:MAG: hypothetical protein ACOYNC_04970 [Bacteroidales bacterium]